MTHTPPQRHHYSHSNCWDAESLGTRPAGVGSGRPEVQASRSSFDGSGLPFVEGKAPPFEQSGSYLCTSSDAAHDSNCKCTLHFITARFNTMHSLFPAHPHCTHRVVVVPIALNHQPALCGHRPRRAGRQHRRHLAHHLWLQHVQNSQQHEQRRPGGGA